ncbi:MAG TPA: hypothetical protein VGG46_15905 [Terriglobales bacterium]|jgi:hypothetical protein
MRKRNLVLMFGLAVAMMFSAAPKAHAGVIVGVRIGAPVYAHPAGAFVYAAPRVYVSPRPFVTVAPFPVYRSFYRAPRPVAFRHVYVRHEYVRRGYNGWRR